MKRANKCTRKLRTILGQVIRDIERKAPFVDRFHVIRLVLQHFLETWRQLDSTGCKNRGLLSLMRRKTENLNPEQQLRLKRYLDHNPAVSIIYEAKEELCALLNIKHQTKRACRPLVRQLINWIKLLKNSQFPAFHTLGNTLSSWRNEIACMWWRFPRNNGITEGFHTKMEMIQRRVYGFRNFESRSEAKDRLHEREATKWQL